MMNVVSVDLQRAPSCAATARAFLTSTLNVWQFADGVDPTVLELLTSEVVTNAFLHTRGRIRLSVMRAGLPSGTIRVEVLDDDPRLPVVVKTGSDAVDGRGMQLIVRQSVRWGAERRGDGKVVWFELALR